MLWLALVFWTWSDARRRIADPMLVGCATAASLFPFIGTIVYMIVRPPEFIEDVRERELEIAAAEARLANSEQLACPYCAFEVEKAFLRCPSCLRRLKEPCNVCRKPLDPRWKICPYCEAEVGAAAPGGPSRRGLRAGRGRPAPPRRQAGRDPRSGRSARSRASRTTAGRPKRRAGPSARPLASLSSSQPRGAE